MHLLYLPYGLFNDAFGSSDSFVSNDMMMNNGLERAWKEAILPQFSYIMLLYIFSCLETLRQTCQNGRISERDVNPTPQK